MSQFRVVLSSVLGFGLLAASSPLCAQQGAKDSRIFRAPPDGVRITANNEFGIIDIEAVQKELALTDDQKSKVKDLHSAFQKASQPDYPAGEKRLDREAMTKVLEEAGKKSEQFTKEKKPELLALLNDQQKTRLTQIVLQAQGRGVYTQPEIQAKLELTAEQKEKLTAISDEYAKRSRDQVAAARRPDGGVDREAFNKTRKDLINSWTKAYQDVLTPMQNEKLDAMKGKEFDLSALNGPGPAVRKKSD